MNWVSLYMSRGGTTESTIDELIVIRTIIRIAVEIIGYFLLCSQTLWISFIIMERSFMR